MACYFKLFYGSPPEWCWCCWWPAAGSANTCKGIPKTTVGRTPPVRSRPLAGLPEKNVRRGRRDPAVRPTIYSPSNSFTNRSVP